MLVAREQTTVTVTTVLPMLNTHVEPFVPIGTATDIITGSTFMVAHDLTFTDLFHTLRASPFSKSTSLRDPLAGRTPRLVLPLVVQGAVFQFLEYTAYKDL